MSKRIQIKYQYGFTIIELMIALTILSVILVMSSVILVQIGATYSKGVNIAALQNANRNVVADISQAIQFGGVPPQTCTQGPSPHLDLTYCTAKPPVGGVLSYCIDNIRYSFVMNQELGTDSGLAVPLTSKHVLWKDKLAPNATSCDPLPILTAANDSILNSDPTTVPGSGAEMMPNHTRLTRFYIVPDVSNGIWRINIWMAYGDSDLVNSNYDTATSPTPPTPPSCIGGPGSQFCAVSNIDTEVIVRGS